MGGHGADADIGPIAGKAVVASDISPVSPMENNHAETRSLPYDLLSMKIIRRLPVKSLMRFRCVSKAWHAMLTDEYRRRKLPLAMSALIYDCHLGDGYKYVSIGPDRTQRSLKSMLSFLPPYRDLYLLDSTNGLLLCKCCYNTSGDELYVCNPATKRWSRIPDWIDPDTHLYSQRTRLVFDPSYSHHYKVVTITQWGKGDIRGMDILSSETGKWVTYRFKRKVAKIRHTTSNICIFIRDCMYLLGRYRSEVIGFDIENKSCWRIERPQATDGMFAELGACKGHLRCAFWEGYDWIVIWDLVDHSKKEWRVKYRVSVQDIYEKFRMMRLPEYNHDISCYVNGIEQPPAYTYLRITAFHPDLDVIFLYVYRNLVSYDLTNCSLESMCELLSGTERLHRCFTYSLCNSEDYDL